ncbi:MAG: 50S ribosomal protein L3 [Nitrosomonas sp.]|nr:MAG: 50S ribosomal protein L3 [Nitrosomonas sp.]
MSLGIIGKKVGMIRLFTESGDSLPITVIDVSNNRVSQIKSIASDGYSAIQLTFGKKKANRVSKAVAGHCAKASIEAGIFVREFKLSSDAELEQFSVGQNIDQDIFVAGQQVDVTGITIGKGFAGSMKLHNFSSNRASHGNSKAHKKPGSIGMAQDPGRVFPGKRMAGHMGNVRRTTQNLEIVKVDHEKKLLLIKGSIPGSKGGIVQVKVGVKNPK